MMIMMLSGDAPLPDPILYVGRPTPLQGSTTTNSFGTLNLTGAGVQDGDLVIFQYAADSYSGTPVAQQSGMSDFNTVATDVAAGVYGSWSYGFWQTGDTNPIITTSTNFLSAWVISAVIFRDVNSYLGSAVANGTSGVPNPPNLVAAGRLWFAGGILDDDLVTFTAPTNYTLAEATPQGGTVSIGTAYRLETLSSDDPDIFGGGGIDAHTAITMAFD